MHQDLSTYLRKKSLNLGNNKKIILPKNIANENIKQ